MLFAHVVIDSVVTALKQSPEAFYAVRMGQTTMGRVRDDINLTLGTNQSLSEQAMESAYLESRDALLRMDVLEQGIEATIRRQENLR